MAPVALITGITGQDGSYLAELLLDKGYDVHGMVRRSSSDTSSRLDAIRHRVTFHQGDLLDQRSLGDVMRASQPDEIYNLAAMSFVGASWNQPVLTSEFTGTGVTRMLEAMRETVPGARFYQASSSEMFGTVKQAPQNEDTPFYPRGQGVRALHHGQLPRELRPVLLRRHPLQPRVAAPRHRLRDPPGLPRGGLDQARHR
jgi:GDPmannose 4,6-dehydratase